ncbi:hypothetical protein AgCh_005251 [Apium graveolens]
MNKPAASGASKAASNKPPTVKTFNMIIQDAMEDSDVIALSLNSVSANVLYDSGATKSFISRDFAHKLRLKVEPLLEPLQVEIANHEVIPVNQIHPPANKMLRKRNEAYIAYIVDTQKEVPNLQDIPVVNEFEDVFPQDLEFAIELAPGMTPVSKVPYRLAPLEMMELATQLQELLDKGHVINKEGVLVDPSKIEAVSNWERPTTPTEVKSFIGLSGFYRRFVQDFAKIAAPLTRLTRKTEKFKWTEKCVNSFQELKKRLVTALVLALLDGKGDFMIYSDVAKRISALGWFISKSGDKFLSFFKALTKVKDFSWTGESQIAFEELKKYMV